MVPIVPQVPMAKKNAKPRGPLLGAHMSIAGGVGNAFLHGKKVACDAIQIFTKSSRQWLAKPYAKEEIEQFAANRKETGIANVIAHDSYLLNLGSPDGALRTGPARDIASGLRWKSPRARAAISATVSSRSHRSSTPPAKATACAFASTPSTLLPRVMISERTKATSAPSESSTKPSASSGSRRFI